MTSYDMIEIKYIYKHVDINNFINYVWPLQISK